MIKTFPKQPGQAAAGATSFLEMMGLISGGWMLARGVIEADMQLKNKQGDKNFLNSKILMTNQLVWEELIEEGIQIL